ncbi:MAG: phosphodiester glycosidase family protein [Lachnospiraceae bacterium]|nr:phosphodiester glycosidase family protein [Lachnospiraceae bacterium]
MGKVIRTIGWIFAFLLGTLAVLFLTLYLLMGEFCNGPSLSARKTFVATMLETGGMKFVPGWYLNDAEIEECLQTDQGTAVVPEADPAADTDVSLVSVSADNDTPSETTPLIPFDEDGIALLTIKGRTFEGALLAVKDPSRLSLSTSYPWSSMEHEKNGLTVGDHCKACNAIAGANAGEFVNSGSNWGGRPMGVVVKDGEILFNEPTHGDVMVGFNADHIMVIAEVGSMGAAGFSTYVKENNIIDAVSFKDLNSSNTNLFTKLIINGSPVDLNGKGAGANPRTCIGQCADGTVLILVTDGRGASGHLGATGQDLIDVMLQYGAVNAANLDGGSSSAMYYDGAYAHTSTYLTYSDSSRRLPTAFIVK